MNLLLIVSLQYKFHTEQIYCYCILFISLGLVKWQMQREDITVVCYRINHSLIKLRFFIHVVSIMHMENADVKKVIKTT